MESKNTISGFLTNHLWQIGTVVFVGAIAVAILQIEYQTLLTRVEAVEEIQAEYPSKDWFELKFTNLEEKIDANTKKLNDR